MNKAGHFPGCYTAGCAATRCAEARHQRDYAKALDLVCHCPCGCRELVDDQKRCPVCFNGHRGTSDARDTGDASHPSQDKPISLQDGVD